MTLLKSAQILVFTAAAAMSMSGSAVAAPAAKSADTERPRIGLVLGGGGVRGAAHIGVLRELQRMRVPIDAVAGTSMGAVVGGLYAAGMSPDELEQLFTTTDWVALLSDKPERKYLSFRRKQDDAQFPINLEMGLRDGEIVLPKGLVQGQELSLKLRELTIGVSDIDDFDDLPTPFRAIATDIGSGDAYVMRSGDLTQAIQASMTVPAILAPVRIDDRLLVDGGISSNLPVDVMRAMGVDIVIAVDVEFPLYSPDDLDSAMSVYEQMLTILIHKETLNQIDSLGESDILLRPDLGMMPSQAFGQIADAIEPGAAAAQAAAGRLQALAVGEREYAAYLASRRHAPAAGKPVSFVRVVEDGREAPAAVKSKVRLKAGEPVDAERFAEAANRLYGSQQLEKVDYRLVEEAGQTGVEFDARSKSWGPNILKFSVALEDGFDGATNFNVGARLTRTDINARGAEWRTDLQLGTEPRLYSELYEPFGGSPRLFVAPHIDVRQSNFNAFVQDAAVARLRVSEATGGVDFGAELGPAAEFRVGVDRGFGSARVKVGDPAIPNLYYDTAGVFARLRVDSRDNAHFPRHGILADLRYDHSMSKLGSDSSADLLQTEFASTWSFGKNSVQLGLNYATTIDSEDAIQDYFPMGGFLRLSGLERGEISGPHAGLARIIYYRRVGRSLGGLFDVPVYLGASVEAGNTWEARSDIGFDSARINGSVFGGLDTYIGPVYFAAGFAEGGETNFYLFVGSPPR
jgi:NTE family protein